MGYVFKNQYGVITAEDEATVNEPKMIRFINPHYQELFKIPDGEQILISYPDGRRKAFQCKYLDSAHLFVGYRAYHICEFAEMMERLGAHIEPFPEKRVIWSNIDLDLKDWIADLRAEYPDTSRDELERIMYETNNDYLDDERSNLNIPCGKAILAIGDIGRWNGRTHGYKVYESGNLSDCLSSDCDYTEWYVDRDGDFRSRQIHHDGTNYICYRKFRDDISSDEKEDLLDQIYHGKATQAEIDRLTEKLGPVISEIYGWAFPTPEKVERVRTGG